MPLSGNRTILIMSLIYIRDVTQLWMFRDVSAEVLINIVLFNIFLHQSCVNHATCNSSGLLKSFDDTSCILLPCFEKKWSHGIIQLTVSFYLSLKHEPHFWFSVLALSIAIIILFYFSFLGSSSFSHTWMFIRRQLRFWRFIQKAYCLYVWWRIIQLTLCCKNIWNRTQTKTF